MIFRSVCSGIEAASVAWNPLGWNADAFSEIEPFPCAVLAHHYPTTPNLGDMTRFKEWPDANFDVLCGGTPCQSFSVAGLRKGLDDPRGNLMLTFGAIAGRYRPRWLVWENVAGVLSSGGGRDFGAFLGLLGVLGYGFAYRLFDAQYFGVAQRRRRVFVVGYLGDWRPAAAVLFERHSLQGHPAPRREAREEIARPLAAGSPGSSGYRNDADTAENLIADTLRAGGGPASHGKLNGTDRMTMVPVLSAALVAKGGTGYMDPTAETFITSPIVGRPYADRGAEGNNLVPVDITNCRIGGAVAGTLERAQEKGNRGLGVMAMNLRGREGGAMPELDDVASIRAASGGSSRSYAVAFHGTQDPDVSGDVTHPMGCNYGHEQAAMVGMRVRRITPRECERLQGFPDDYTAIPYNKKPAKDGPRYKALGNSWAVPNARWIGQRIDIVTQILNASKERTGASA